MKRTVLCLIVSVAISLMAGCSSDGKSALEDTQWVLTSLRGNPLLDETEITLKFENEILSGSAGCSSYGGGPDSGRFRTTEKGALEIPTLAITAELCTGPDGIMEQEMAYVAALISAKAYVVEEDRLEMRDADGEIVLVYVRQ